MRCAERVNAALRFFLRRQRVHIWEERHMETPQLLELLAAGPVIAAVKDEEGLAQALESDVSVLFLLYGDVLTIRDTAERVREAGKRVFVHLDLIDGLAAREISADFIARSTSADGVISTKAALTRRARELGLVAIQRIFLLDSMALKKRGAALLPRIRRSGGGAARADAQDHPPPVRHHRQAHHRRGADHRQGGRDRRPGRRSGGGVLHQSRRVADVARPNRISFVSGE